MELLDTSHSRPLPTHDNMAPLQSETGAMEDTGESEATLASVLAFVDAWDAWDDSGSDPSSEASATSPPTRAKKAKNRPGYTTMLQRRKRDEVLALREQARELEMQLQRLQRRPVKANNSQKLSPVSNKAAKWSEAAVVQFRQRRRAEQQNRKLKALLERQATLHATIAGVIDKHKGSSLESPRVSLFSCDTTAVCRAFGPKEVYMPNEVIKRHLLRLHDDRDMVFGGQVEPTPGSISCSLEWKSDPTIGRFVEIRASTAVSRSVANARALLWEGKIQCLKSDCRKYVNEVDPSCESYVKKFLLPIAAGGPANREIMLNCQHYSRKFESAGQAVIVMLALVQPPVDGVYLREDFWTRIRLSPTRPEQEAAIETCYRIHAEFDGPSSDEAAQMSQTVIKALTKLTRTNLLATQDYLLDASELSLDD